MQINIETCVKFIKSRSERACRRGYTRSYNRPDVQIRLNFENEFIDIRAHIYTILYSMRLMDRKHAMRVHVNLRCYSTCICTYYLLEQRAFGPKIAYKL